MITYSVHLNIQQLLVECQVQIPAAEKKSIESTLITPPLL